MVEKQSLQRSVKVFISYTHEDKDLLKKLKDHLEGIRKQGLISVWHDREINAGTEWEREIDQQLSTSQIILLLISASFLASDYCYGREMQRAMELHEQGKSRVIPIILRPVYWQGASFGKLQALPTDAKPITSREWHSEDEAFLDIIEGIRKTIEQVAKTHSVEGLSAQRRTQPPESVDDIGQSQLVVLCPLAETQVFAVRLCKALERELAPTKIWLDRRDIGPNEDWQDKTIGAVKTCDKLLFVMTRDSVQPESVYNLVWTLALQYKKPIIPLLLDHDIDIPPRLANRRYLDFSQDFDKGLTELLAYLSWLDSPVGILQIIRDRLKDAQYTLKYTVDNMKRIRLTDEIFLLRKDITQQKKLINDPETVLLNTQQRIDLGLEREKRSAKVTVSSAKCKVVNQSPSVVPSYFQDRFIETKLIGDILRGKTQRLITVVGRGGIGKTAMVCRLLESLENGRLPDDGGPLKVNGIVYLSSTGWRRVNMINLYYDLCALLPKKVAHKLDTLYKEPQVSIKTKISALLAEFSAGLVILLLDNFEDIIDHKTRQITDTSLNEALHAILELPVHSVKVIITTRISPQELLLTNPELQAYIQLDEGLSSPYAENILREMDPDGKLGLKNANDSLLTSVCAQTRGYPRALEALVAALRADSYTSLDDLLKVTQGQLPQNVVQALVGEAFSRLDPISQKILQALAIYNRPVTSIAIDYVLQPYVAGLDSAPILSRLSTMHFVRREALCYYLHPIDRAYALGRIHKGEQSDREADPPPFTRLALLHRGAEYFRQVRKDETSWKTIEDLAEPLAEFDLQCEAEAYDKAAETLMAVDNKYLFVWGLYHIVAELHERIQDHIGDKRLKVLSLRRQGAMYGNMGQSRRAITYLEQSRAIAQEIGDRANEGRAQWNIALAYEDLGQTTRAIEYHEQALLIARKINDRWFEGAILGSLGASYEDLGNIEQAIECCELGVTITRDLGARLMEEVALSNLVRALISAGHYTEAIQHTLEGLQTTNPRSGSYNNGYLALAHLYMGNWVSARKAAEAARKYNEPLNNHFIQALLGIITLLQNDYANANEAFLLAIKYADQLLEYSPGNLSAWEAKGVALCGLAVYKQDTNYVSSAIEVYKKTRAINNNKGYIDRSTRLFRCLAKAQKAEILAPMEGIIFL